MATPPPLPAKIKARGRILLVAAMDGWGILLVAGGTALVSLFFLEWTGVIVGALACGAGWMELHGRALLQAGLPDAFSWLRKSQLWLLTVIVGYATWMLWQGVPDGLIERIMEVAQVKDLVDVGVLNEAVLTQSLGQAFQLIYLILIVVAGFYQGSMWLYYFKAERRSGKD